MAGLYIIFCLCSPEYISSQNLKLMVNGGLIWMDITRLPEKHSFPFKHILMSVYVGSAFEVYYYYYFQFGWYRTSEHISM